MARLELAVFDGSSMKVSARRPRVYCGLSRKKAVHKPLGRGRHPSRPVFRGEVPRALAAATSA